MKTTSTLLLLLPLLALGCDGPPGADGTNGVDGADGADGTNGTDGVDGTNGTDGSAVLSGTVAPGEYLALEHGLGTGDKFYEAQFTWNGVVYDHRDYPTLRPAHHADGAWFPNDTEQYSSDLAATILTSGDLLVVTEGYDDEWDNGTFYLNVHNWDGSVASAVDSIASDWSDSDGYAYSYDPLVVPLTDGGFAFMYRSYGYDYTAGEGWEHGILHRYDSSGVWQNSVTLGENDDWSVYDIHATALSDGGMATMVSGWDDNTDDEFMSILIWGSDGSSSELSVPGASDSEARMAELSDGRLVVLLERQPETGADGIDVVILQRDGTVDAEVALQRSYLTDDCALAVSTDDTILVAAESGGPDLPFYAVIAADGTLLQPATGMSGWENTMIEAAAFPDGDFMVMVTEDDSLAPMTWVVGNQGALLRPMVIGDITVVPDYDPGVFMQHPNGALAHMAPSYDSDVPPYMSLYTKGLLQVRVESDDEVRLYNHTPDPLDVTLVAHRTP